MELRVAKINNNDLVIKPILKSFYCRYCQTVAGCRGHRSGFWVVFEVVLNSRKYLIIDGFGNSEKGSIIHELVDDWETIYWGMSSARTFYSPKFKIYNHVTCGGWDDFYPLPRIVELDDDLKIKIEELKKKSEYLIQPTDIPTIMKLLRANLIRKYKLFADVDIKNVEFYPEFADLLPLLKAYKRKRTIVFPYGATITELANCFTSVFKLKNIEFKIPKELNYIKHEFPDQVKIQLMKNLFITYFYDEKQDKAVVYCIEEYSPCCFSIVGYEQYKEILHQRLSMTVHRDYLFLNKLLDVFFNYRLGDILFVPIDSSYFEILSKEFSYARAEQFNKINLENAKLEENILRPIDRNLKIKVSHPEHGVLELSPDDYACLTFVSSHD